MAKPADELLKLSNDVQSLSLEIAALKREKDRLPAGPEKSRLNDAVKLKQYQALFYIAKIENMSKELKTK